MKKIILIFLLLVSTYGFSQKITSEEIINQLEKTEHSKSGNYKDVLASFSQLALKNIAGDDKTISLNTTLFQLKAKANPELLQDIYFKNETFSRNFQFNFKINMDEQFKYAGFTGGFNYAIINGRDKQIAVLTNSLYGTNHEKIMTVIEEIQVELLRALNDSNRADDMAKIESATESILNGKSDPNNDYYDKIIVAFKEKTKNNTDFKNKDLQDFITHLQNLKTNEYNKIEAKPLWTISAESRTNTEGKFNNGAIKTVFLKGNAEGWNEIDIRAKLVYNDTLIVNPITRSQFNTTAGMNFKIGKSKENISYFEIKTALEYNHIFRNLLPEEKQSNFLGNAEIRIRLTNDLWFPILIKYDLEKANFLGFLNVSYNFGGFNNNRKK
jgi:hypothetical protein